MLTLLLLSLVMLLVCLLVIGVFWHLPAKPRHQSTPPPVVVLSPHSTPTPSPFPSPTDTPTPSPTASQAQRIDTYIDHLTVAQQMGQLLMLAVYANSYTTALNQPLQQWDIANVIVFNQYNGGPLMPTTLSGLTQLVQNLQAHANQVLIIATDEEGGEVDRLAPYYGPSPSAQELSASGDPKLAYAQAQVDAERLFASGINTDFAPLADVYQGGAVDQSRMFGTTPEQMITYAGAFLDGLQHNGVMGTLKHWPGIGSASVNPDYGLPTITHSQYQLNATVVEGYLSLLKEQGYHGVTRLTMERRLPGLPDLRNLALMR